MLIELGESHPEFFLKIDLDFLLGKTGSRLNLKIDLVNLNFFPDVKYQLSSYLNVSPG